MSSPASIDTDWPLAAPWRRLAAAVIDAFILLVPCAALVYIHPALAIVAAIAYGTVLEVRARHATPGKRVCALEVGVASGEAINVRAALIRNAIKYGGLAFAGSMWGFLVPLAIFAPAFAPGRQGLHDLAARTLVRHEPKQGLSDVAVGAIGVVGPFLLVVALLPVVLSPLANARARQSVEAAIRGAADRRAHVEGYLAREGRLPGDATIELHPEDVKGRVVLRPQVKGNTVQWECRGEGVPRGQLPKECRGED
jgi:uncharacterized RDD family membrane protein YckC